MDHNYNYTDWHYNNRYLKYQFHRDNRKAFDSTISHSLLTNSVVGCFDCLSGLLDRFDLLKYLFLFVCFLSIFSSLISFHSQICVVVCCVCIGYVIDGIDQFPYELFDGLDCAWEINFGKINFRIARFLLPASPICPCPLFTSQFLRYIDAVSHYNRDLSCVKTTEIFFVSIENRNIWRAAIFHSRQKFLLSYFFFHCRFAFRKSILFM